MSLAKQAGIRHCRVAWWEEAMSASRLSLSIITKDKWILTSYLTLHRNKERWAGREDKWQICWWQDGSEGYGNQMTTLDMIHALQTYLRLVQLDYGILKIFVCKTLLQDDGQVDGWMDGWMGGWADGWVDVCIDKYVDERIAGWKMYGQMNR